ncbi:MULTISPECIES: ATP-dependent zinc metalloprotease FtsH [Thioalkalivibrio]|uniref:ATP-dependent zinc metalloprotease FtsH n=1 Tax=Thioalkalivibrio halophilus TaxID=252474 RepID=A0A1V3A0X5_9GAMM|nr:MULTISPECIES: ATP-dependent zinc metalloprotease FtsH [Thioalkalivibrio]OOC11017.1 ATP-dependent metalloprotease [Thioalkalivibrio halophilus]PYG02646.1 membrane protease FtsH catalytic subunit [Thioalkalivibrio sp. ALE21]
MNGLVKNLIIWAVIAVVLMSIFNNFAPDPEQQATRSITYSEFIQQVQSGRVDSVTIEGDKISGQMADGERFSTVNPNDSGLIGDLLNHNVEINAEEEAERGLLMSILISWFPILLLIAVWIYFMRQMQGGGAGGKGAMSFGKSKAKLMSEDQVKVTFADVAGCDEAKDEVVELVDFLKDPGKFQKLGGQIPRGVLMVGSPGTGKTLLAKAIAGEAKVPFYSISGSDFVEMFVGVGASRVRDMFAEAKKNAPCIIFIDELDAVGRQRGGGMGGGGHDEREQTLNQLLVEMDGFEGTEGVIVIAATNRPDVLDQALLRPGRFDRQVVVPPPDVRGREQILNVHMKKTPIAEDVNPHKIARGTPGFSGADLANLVNEAALFAARAGKRLVDMSDFERAKDKIMMGAERRSMVMSEDEKKLTAYHEAGHAIVGLTVPEHDPVYKVSIIPRGRALGVTMFLPEEDRYSHSRTKLESQIASLFGGRLAEEIIFGEKSVTTGASNDIEKASQIARNMVTKWGLSEKLGPLDYGEDEQQSFLGPSMGKPKQMSDDTANAIDEEVRKIIDTHYNHARQILVDNLDKLHAMAGALMKYETIDDKQIGDIMAGREPREPADWNDGSSGGDDAGTPAGEGEAGDGSDDSRDSDSDRGVVGGPAPQS